MGFKELEDLFGKIDTKSVLVESLREALDQDFKYGGFNFESIKLCTAIVVYDEEFALKQFIRQIKNRKRNQ